MNVIRKRTTESVAILSVALLMAITLASGCGGGKSPSNVLDPVITQGRILNAALVTTDPTIDGTVDSVWSSAAAVSVPLGDGMSSNPDCTACHAQNSPRTLSLKAVYSTTKISILAVWSDSDASLTRGSSWTYNATDTDGNAWTKTPSSGSNEDRIAFFWPISSIQGTTYNTGGCMTKCHTSDTDGDGEYSDDESFLADGTADLWHGKAARALGTISGSQSTSLTINSSHEVTAGSITLNGYMEDTEVQALATLDDNAGNANSATPTDHENGRQGDEGNAPASQNRSADKSRPKYMETAPTDYIDAMVLTQTEIDAGEVVGDSVLGVTEAEAAANWAAYSALNAIVPERILDTPTLSGSDIRQSCTWSNGWWTCEIQRDLQTTSGAGATNADDVQFTVTNDYTFGVAVIDNGGGTEHETSDKYTLHFLP